LSVKQSSTCFPRGRQPSYTQENPLCGLRGSTTQQVKSTVQSPDREKRGKPDSLMSSILCSNGEPDPDRDISWSRCHLEASHRCVSHMEKEMREQTASLGVIL